jgi:hypothetical protein
LFERAGLESILKDHVFDDLDAAVEHIERGMERVIWRSGEKL